jgi:hypothetical protein
MSEPCVLPHYEASQFEKPAVECDAIMKGGVTSGIVYPYAILEIATRYRFRSLGGTSAGAIAAAFAAAAEYSRSVRNDSAGFVRLQRYCDELPSILLGLFQPDAEFEPALRIARRAATDGTLGVIGHIATRVLGLAVVGAIIALLIVGQAEWLSIAFGAILGAFLGLMAVPYLTVYRPLTLAKQRLVSNGFGACSGLTLPGSQVKGLTDWLYGALQDIAFGSPTHPDPLTFGDLEKPANGTAPIFLRMVTTNLSMGRPHTLPQLGIQAGFRPSDWQALFPTAVLTYLNRKSGPWNGVKGVRRMPPGDDLPVICAVRMSLSFPVLFKAIPILTFDHEFKSVVKALGGTPERRLCTVWLTDGGLSSNFPIHLFDSPLPSRPTFAISLDSLQVTPDRVTRRVLLPETSLQGSGVQVTEIKSLADFGWQVLAAAKDWQDQLASEITGQRERIARIFLDRSEGGLNLDMPEEVSRSLMQYGLDAGRLFSTAFVFDEHRWRRMLGVYRNTSEWIDRTAVTWTTGFGLWFAGYQQHVQSYEKLTQSDRKLIAKHFSQLAAASSGRETIKRADDKFPAKTGQLRVTGRY